MFNGCLHFSVDWLFHYWLFVLHLKICQNFLFMKVINLLLYMI